MVTKKSVTVDMVVRKTVGLDIDFVSSSAATDSLLNRSIMNEAEKTELICPNSSDPLNALVPETTVTGCSFSGPYILVYK
ncbi:unnamed protein product [Macrosiphum euphorbiae]|uniref:Uncharacterized protein n=1 Tax=Macrosiphum euphorbiae TaxID=13131 RepID=A0AAV0WUH9_9HEMI|nr:unnamed protein product [Macrosiphum euphorbiae]